MSQILVLYIFLLKWACWFIALPMNYYTVQYFARGIYSTDPSWPLNTISDWLSVLPISQSNNSLFNRLGIGHLRHKQQLLFKGKNDHFRSFWLIRPKKIYVCVYCYMSKKSRIGRSGLLLLFFFLFLIGKTRNSHSRYFLFEIFGKMTNYAVFLPSLLSISTKS